MYVYTLYIRTRTNNRTHTHNAAETQNNKPINRILHCSTCTEYHILPTKGELHPHEVLCKICGYQVLTVRNVENGREHTICPYCFK